MYRSPPGRMRGSTRIICSKFLARMNTSPSIGTTRTGWPAMIRLMLESVTSSNIEWMSGESATRPLLPDALGQQGQRFPPGPLLERRTGAELRGLPSTSGGILSGLRAGGPLMIGELRRGVHGSPEGATDAGEIIPLPRLEESEQGFAGAGRPDGIPILRIRHERADVGL